MAGTGFDKTNARITHALLCEGASPRAVLAMNRITGLCRAYGVCTLAAGTFAAELCTTKQGFLNIRKWLEQNGYISIQKSTNTVSEIRLTQKVKDLYVMSGAYSDTELKGVNSSLPPVNYSSLHGVNSSLPKQNISRGEAPPLQAGRASLIEEGEWCAE